MSPKRGKREESPRPRPQRSRKTPDPSRRSRSEPVRTCVGCRRRRPQGELVRFVRNLEGSVVAGRTLPGRGAWLCADTLDECRAVAERRNAFAKAFRQPG